MCSSDLSERPGTLAGRKLKDDVSEETKFRRLQEIVDLQRKHSGFRTQEFVGQTVEVLIDKESKKSDLEWAGRNSQNLTVVFPKGEFKLGDFVKVTITDCTTGTLKGVIVNH